MTAPSIKHKFQSAKGDGTDNTLIQPSNWNDDHDLEVDANTLVGRTSPGRGAAEAVTIGTGSGQVAAGDHTHAAADITGLATVAKTGSYNDLSDKPTGDDLSGFVEKSKNLSDIPDKAAARTNLGLANAVLLDGDGKYPAGDGSALTNLNAAPDISSSTYPVGATIYVIYRGSVGTSIADGSTTPGSNLRRVVFISSDGSTPASGEGAALPGTWKNLTGATVGPYIAGSLAVCGGLFRRTA